MKNTDNFTPEKIQRSVLAAFGISKEEMEAKNRKTNYADCRHAIVHMLTKYTALSYAKISPYLGSRSRATIANSKKIALSLVETDQAFAGKVKCAEEAICN